MSGGVLIRGGDMEIESLSGIGARMENVNTPLQCWCRKKEGHPALAWVELARFNIWTLYIFAF